jgi:hypothetical protein
MSFFKAKLPNSIVVPAHWTLPRYQFNERVKYFQEWCGERTGVIRGIEFIESEYELGTSLPLETGWHYDILVDKDVPNQFISPKDIIHENQIKKLIKNQPTVTLRARRNQQKILVVCRS